MAANLLELLALNNTIRGPRNATKPANLSRRGGGRREREGERESHKISNTIFKKKLQTKEQ